MSLHVQTEQEITLNSRAPRGYGVPTNEVAVFRQGPGQVHELSECSILYGFSRNEPFMVAHVSSLCEVDSLKDGLEIAMKQSGVDRFYAFNMRADRASSQKLARVCEELGIRYEIQDVQINVADTLHLNIKEPSRYSVERGNLPLRRYRDGAYD